MAKKTGKPSGKAVAKATGKGGRQTVTAKAAKPAKARKGKADAGGHLPYKYHKASRKASVHRLFDEKGADAALAYGLELGLAQGTLKSWFADFKRETNPKATTRSESFTTVSEAKPVESQAEQPAMDTEPEARAKEAKKSAKDGDTQAA